LTTYYYNDKRILLEKFYCHILTMVIRGAISMENKKQYEAPEVITYSEDEIVEMLGPAQTCSPSPCPTYQ
jgi:hypothetical protein